MRRQTNVLLGLVLVLLSGVLLARALGMIPDPVYDLMLRGAPALLVALGLGIFLRDRVPFGSAIALLVTGGLVALVVNTAFTTRAALVRDDYRFDIAQPVPADVTLVRVSVRVLATEIQVQQSATRTIGGAFTGSLESQIDLTFTPQNDGTADLTLVETQPAALPLLDRIGRGVLRLELPPGVALDVSVVNADGAITLNMDGLALERLNADAPRGNILVTLPAYQPLATARGDLLGTLAARSGDLTVVLPRNVAGRFELTRGGSGIQPVYDPLVFTLFNDLLESRVIQDDLILLHYALAAPRGTISVRVAGSDG